MCLTHFPFFHLPPSRTVKSVCDVAILVPESRLVAFGDFEQKSVT